MKRILTLTALLTSMLALTACAASIPTPSPSPTPTATLTPLPTVTPIPPTRPPSPTSPPTHTPTATQPIYQAAFGIDYANPDQYLTQGEQTQISDPSVLEPLRAESPGLAQLADIYRWLKKEFTSYRAGGKTIGVVTVEQLLAERQLGGCHDYGLVFAAAARTFDYPTVMFHAVSLAWVEQVQAGQQGPRYGHVYVEVYLDGSWLLIDPTNGWYIEQGYDPADPVIPITGPLDEPGSTVYGYYAQHKGLDTWDTGIHSPQENSQAMDTFAEKLDLSAVTYPEYEIKHFSNLP